MFGSELLDVALGLMLVYLLLSLVASGVREMVEARLKTRSASLERGIREILRDPTGEDLARALYEHPLVSSLYAGSYAPTAGLYRKLVPLTRRGLLGRLRGKEPGPHVGEEYRGVAGEAGRGVATRLLAPSHLPSYIPASSFALALLDIAARGRPGAQGAHGADAPALTVENVRAGIERIGNPAVQRALLSAVDRAGGDMARAQLHVEAWFNGSMDRVSGWYKRHTQAFLFAFGLGAAVVLNVNTITIVEALSRHETLRAVVVSEAERVAAGHTLPRDSLSARTADLEALGLPMGWRDGWPGARVPGAPDPTAATGYEWVWLNVVSPVVGWLLTAFAVSLGAPFWFDLLNRVMVIRSTVKPHEKSLEEGSEDRMGTSTPVPAPRPPPALPSSAEAEPTATSPSEAAPDPPTPAAAGGMPGAATMPGT